MERETEKIVYRTYILDQERYYEYDHLEDAVNKVYHSEQEKEDFIIFAVSLDKYEMDIVSRVVVVNGVIRDGRKLK